MTTTPDPRFVSKPLYDIYLVVIQMRGRIYGGVPKNPEMIKAWIKARTKFNDDLTEVQTQEALDILVDETATKGWTGFQGDDTGLFISTNNVKAMLKQGASILNITRKRLGSKQILAEGSEVKALSSRPDRLYLGCNEADGFEERPIHVSTPQGPRTALKRIDYIENVTLTFEIWVLRTHSAEKRHIGEDELIQILTFSQENGLGADRSQGAGKFDVLKFERTSEKVEEEESEVKSVKGKAAKSKGNSANALRNDAQ